MTDDELREHFSELRQWLAALGRLLSAVAGLACVILLTLIVLFWIVALHGCGSASVESAQLAPVTVLPAPLASPTGHTQTTRNYATWCGPACRCAVTVSQDCAEDGRWDSLPQPDAPYQDLTRITPSAGCGG